MPGKISNIPHRLTLSPGMNALNFFIQVVFVLDKRNHDKNK